MNKLKVNDIFLESSSVIAQTFRVNNLGEISTRQGGSSNNFKLPLTSTNRKALGFPEDLNNLSRSQYKRLEASLYDGNTFVTNGTIKINSVDNDSISATFFSDNVGWINLIKDKTLKDLNLANLNHQWTGVNIRASLSNTEGYIYPIIDYGEFKAQSLSDDILVDQLYPAVYVKTLFEQIFKDANYQIEGDLLTLFEYNQAILPFSISSLTNSKTYIEENTFNVSIDTQDPTINDLDPPLDLDVDGGNTSFDITSAGKYNVLFSIEVDNISGSGDVSDIRFKVNKSGGGTIAQLTIDTLTNGVFSILAENVELSLSDNSFTVTLETAGTGTGDVVPEINTNNSFVSFTPSDEVIAGGFIEISRTLPDIKQSDFIKYIANLFGLIITTSKTKKLVSFDLFKNINNNINDAIDWSDKIDISKNRDIDFTELVGDYGSKSLFDYKEDDNDQELLTYLSQNGVRFGTGTLTIDNEHISNEKTIYEAPFAGSINILSFLEQSLYVPQIKWLDSTGAKEDDPEPKILLIKTGFDVLELTGGLVGSLLIDGVIQTTIPFAWFAKAAYTTSTNAFSQSLSFGDITFTANTEGTLSRYWGLYEDVLSNMKYLKAEFALNAVDVNNLDFTKPVYIDFFKSYFYINSVNEFTGSEELTEVELVKIQ